MAVSDRPTDSFRDRLTAFAREIDGVRRGNVEALHRARVASRRLRELLPLLDLDAETTRKLNRQLRRVTKQLGTVREFDVLIGSIDEFARRRRYSAVALARLRYVIGRRRAAVRKHLAYKLPTRKLVRLVIRLARVVRSRKSIDPKRRLKDHGGAKPAWRRTLDARLARRATRVQRAIEVAGALYAAEPLHEVRIALKKLRYATELSQEAGRARLTADVNALKAAQELLGRLHDYEVLIAAGREVQASLSPPAVATWRELKGLAQTIEDDCRHLHARYMRDRRRLVAIADRLGAGQALTSAASRRAAG